MLTPQEVSTRAFAKAMMGGYNMAAVDEFLDELTDDYTALYKENAALKAKMKVLVEKVEEYRATEDSMRATLLTAQRMADSIIQEAEAKRDQMLQEAESDLQQRAAGRQRELEESEERLRRGQQELGKFIAASRDLCEKQAQFLDQLPQMELAPPPPPPEASAAEEIEEKVLAAFPVRELPEEEPKALKVPEEPEAPEAPEKPGKVEEIPPVDEYPAGDPFAPEEPTRRINLEELKFGRNYGTQED